MKRICLDGLPLQVRSAGIATYTEQLVRGLAELSPQCEIALFGLGELALRALRAVRPDANFSPFPENVTWIRSEAYPLRMGYPILQIPRCGRVESSAGAFDVFHATNYIAPRSAVPTVLTIHDLALLHFPELGTAPLRRLVERTRRCAHEAGAIIAVSEATRRDVIALLDVPGERVHVIHHGVAPHFCPASVTQIEEIRQRFRLEKPYLLHVGTLEPRKNLPRLIEAYVAAVHQAELPHDLVLAGAPGWKYEPIEQCIARLGVNHRVRRLGAIAPVDLPALYSGAEVFVYPSLYEGFGLPLLEAMSCGTPVVTSDVSSLPEVAGDCALLVDPNDTEALAAALVRMLTDPQLREDCRARGMTHARAFTWQRCAGETLDVYRRVAP